MFGMVRAVVHSSYAVHHINSPGCPKLLQHTYTYGEDEDGPYLRISMYDAQAHKTHIRMYIDDTYDGRGCHMRKHYPEIHRAF